ncbi:MAG: cupin [Chloroflexi bacterium]|nr:cupin [Chloroflexota bacterium]|tara:strand:- start:7525 stop:7878 length:354 start_codon:yes stop_codon:yes gene_type:complete
MSYFYNADNLSSKQLAEGINLKTLWGKNIMMSLVEMDANAEVPKHSHPHEQAGIVLEGEFEFIIGDESKIIKKGEFYIIPGNIEHKVIVGNAPSVALDIFSPPREEYKSESVKYKLS